MYFLHIFSSLLAILIAAALDYRYLVVISPVAFQTIDTFGITRGE